jgi:hypothetical protein
MSDKPVVKIVELGETLDQLEPTLAAVREIAKKLPVPNDFLLYPVLMASMIYEMSGGNYETARQNYSDISDIVIYAYSVMRQKERARAAAEQKADEVPAKGDMH